MQVVVAGHICLDIIPLIGESLAGSFFNHFKPGHLLEIGPAAVATGGPVSNTGLALHKLGIPTRLMGKVGDDHFGRVVREIVANCSPSLEQGMIVSTETTTSYSIIISQPGVDRIFLHCPGANHTFCAEDVNYNLVGQSDLFHFGYPPLMRLMYVNDGIELLKIFKQVKARQVITSLDMAFPDPASPAGQANWPEIYRQVLPYVDIFLPSVEELLIMLHRPIYDRLLEQSTNQDLLSQVTPDLLSDLSQELLDLGAKIVVLKLGKRGLYLRTARVENLSTLGHGINRAAWAGCEYWSPCFQVEVVGTTGSGDATIAGFLSGLLRGMGPEETLSMAVAVGACNVEAADALSGIRSWEETLARVQNAWPRHRLVVDTPGWYWDSIKQLWVGKRNTQPNPTRK